VSTSSILRTRRNLSTTLSLIVTLCSCSGTPGAQAELPDPEAGNRAVAEWRAKHEADYRRDFVTIANLHLLQPGANTAGSAPANDIVLPASVPAHIGRFVLEGEQVRYEPSPAAPVSIKGAQVTASVALRDDGSRDADELVIGDVRLVVHLSGHNPAIRVRDPNGPLARAFAGFSWFPIDAGYRVRGRIIRDPAPRQFKVVNTYGDLDEFTSEGVVEFTLNGETLRLRPFTTRPGRLYFIFKDGSSGQETYKTARFLYSDLADDGTTVLDFNAAYNPPCAFNPYTTCPLPLPENRLPVKILAGEKAYRGQAPADHASE